MVQRTTLLDEPTPSPMWRVDFLVHARPPLAMAAILIVLGGTERAAAFPFLDSTSTDQVPSGTELASPDVQSLQQQLQLANGLAPPAGGGWTIVPRIDWQEELTDNVLEANSPRRADLVTFLSPGINIAGDLPRVKATFDFAPTLALYARTSDLNAVTEQMNGLATVTLVPDLFFVDLRAMAGIQSLYGGVGGLGTLGQPAGPAATAQAQIPGLGGNYLGLNANSEVQTSTVGISPYILRRFGDYGTWKIGDSLNVTRSAEVSGFLASPLPSAGGAYGQTLVSNEENAHFVSGDILSVFQDTFDADMLVGQTTQNAIGAGINGGVQIPATQYTSSSIIVTDQISYAVNRSLSVFVSGGHEDITYSNQSLQGVNGSAATGFNYNNIGIPQIHDLTWSLGATWTPSPDSSLTVSYGHLDGFNSLSVNGHYAPTARTLWTVSYGSTLGTQLQQLQGQLNLAGTNGTGALVNAQTGGQLFGAANALGVQGGVFKTTTLALGSQTTWNRDIVAVNLLMAAESNFGAGIASYTAQTETASLSWLHQLEPDMTLSTSASYAIQSQPGGGTSIYNPGNTTSIVASLAWQWQLSPTVSTSARYSFLEQQASYSAFSFYQNIFIVGISKHF